MNTPPRKNVPWQSGLQSAAPYLGLGMQLAATMVFYIMGGYFLDRWLDTKPWLMIVGAVLGMVALFVQLIRVSNKLTRETAERKKQKEAEEEKADTHAAE